MGYGHTPFGYRIENGNAVVAPLEAEQIRELYKSYLSGLSYEDAAKKVGLAWRHASVKRALGNKHYLGDEFYPPIIDEATFKAAEEERLRRVARLGRGSIEKMDLTVRRVKKKFSLRTLIEKRSDPYEQAAYIYSLIESEE